MNICEQLSTPVSNECDVLVCGGGIAGVAAALAAKRQNKKVILLEKGFQLGGLATSGLITVYLALCDGYGHQVSFGLAEELLRTSIKNHCEARYPENWLDSSDPTKRTEKDNRFEVIFNANLCAIELEKLLTDEGVKILYGTYAVQAITESKKISAVVVENKSGRSAIIAKSVVDATGDADIAKFASVPTETFKQGNVLAAWYYAFCNEKGYHCRPMGCCDIPEDRRKEGEKVDTLSRRRFGGLDAEEISEFTQLSHMAVYDDVLKFRQQDKSYVPATLATVPELRMTRKLAGEYVLDDTEDHKRFETSVGMVSDWRKRGPVYEVPFETLYSKECKNLIFAGRCTSVTEPMWDIMRVIPCCAVTGQAAGVAAAMTDDFTALDVKELQNVLVKNNVVLHWDDIDK